MEHIPQKDKKGKRLSVCFLIVACIGLIGAVLLDLEYRWFYQLIAVMTYVISFEILNRYYLATYCYRLDENDFMIRKTTGKRAQTLCNLELSTMIGIEKQPKTKSEKEALAKRYGKITIHYNYCQSLAPKDPYVILFEFNGKIAQIAFEPNKQMVCRLNEILHTRNEL